MFSWESIKEKAGPPFLDMEIPLIDAGPALVYLMRRFGYPNIGSDAYKEVCDYLLPTGQDGAYLIIHIEGTSAQLGLTVDKETRSALLAQMLPGHGQKLWVEETELGQACIEACAATLRDLLRPVRVRDVWIDILGRTEPGDLGKWNEVEERYENTAAPWHAAGYGVPEGCYDDPVLFIRFMTLIKELGDSNVANGMRQAINQLDEKVNASGGCDKVSLVCPNCREYAIVSVDVIDDLHSGSVVRCPECDRDIVFEVLTLEERSAMHAASAKGEK